MSGRDRQVQKPCIGGTRTSQNQSIKKICMQNQLLIVYGLVAVALHSITVGRKIIVGTVRALILDKEHVGPFYYYSRNKIFGACPPSKTQKPFALDHFRT